MLNLYRNEIIQIKQTPTSDTSVENMLASSEHQQDLKQESKIRKPLIFQSASGHDSDSSFDD
jgi:hypothetical protein